MRNDAVVLLRVSCVGVRERVFAEQLEVISSLTVAYLVDARKGTVPAESRPIVAIDNDRISGLGLHLTDDYAWRCGDYGLYLARRQFPNVNAFWIIEGDVRIAGEMPELFFSAMEHSRADLLVGHFEPATRDYWWSTHGRGRGVIPHKCLFSAVRISARLADALLQKRRQHARSRWRKAAWPNDEVFVATTAVKDGFEATDFNDVGGPWYSAASFAYAVTLDGDNLPAARGAQLLHSVRWLEDGEKRTLNPRSRDDRTRLTRRVAKLILPYLRW